MKTWGRWAATGSGALKGSRALIRIWAGIGAATILAPSLAFGACGAGNLVRDWGLHLEWVVEHDADHPERPARLVEVPWNAAGVEGQNQTVCAPRGPGAGKAAPLPAPEVRIGMRVTAWREDESADIHLRGTALGTARRGERVSVKAGLGGAVLDGIVRGPGLVELLPQKDDR
jgi:hypothetical protein